MSRATDNTQSGDTSDGRSRTLQLTVPEMDCPSCAGKVTKSVEKLDGIEELDPQPTTGALTVTFDPLNTDEEMVLDRVEKAGYDVQRPTEEATPRKQGFVPALGYRILTPLYDPILHITLREKKWKSATVERLSLEDGEVLDLGCGTGTLTVEIAQHYPDTAVHGIDIDPAMLAIARDKIMKDYQHVQLVRGTVTDLPYPDDHFDSVISSLVFHHLTTDQKLVTMSEVQRVLRPGGEFHLIDWGRPASRLQRASFYIIQLLDGFDTTSDNIDGKHPVFLDQSGFKEETNPEIVRTPLGTIRIHRVTKP
ncbi:methyltransferase domain-containing protein [Saliphagus infecundisoli]|uniref:Methyltransferase domain-containing protein n=1 Tax=Saliphagus infecundisoli TaxID=1849069 RepID=A0ABD5QJ14_9EURY|nr:methyltransferase domain-containing protein [Saliphagus infecundisoli]